MRGRVARLSCFLRRQAIIRLVLSGIGLTALLGSEAAFAQDSSIPLPEIRVVPSTPLSPPAKPKNAAPAPTAAQPALVAPAAGESALPRDPGLIERDKIPANVQTLSAADFDSATSMNLTEALVRGLPGVALSDQTGNEFQRDLDYRGFIASPVIGTAQGLAVYQNGVRINEVFGDIVNWDLIPEHAINRMTLTPSNPIYGLNALGGALSVDMKNGFTYQGVETILEVGSFGRRSASVQAGGQAGNLSGYVAADAIGDDGWRQFSPSQIGRVYGDFGARGDRTEFHLSFTGASNEFGAAAATPVQMLNANWASVYTVPQTTRNQLAFVTANASWNPTDTLSFQSNLYYRGFWQSHVDGNGTDAQNSGCPDPTYLCFPNLDGTLQNLIAQNGQPVPATGVLATSILGEIDRTFTAANSSRRRAAGGNDDAHSRSRQSFCRGRQSR